MIPTAIATAISVALSLGLAAGCAGVPTGVAIEAPAATPPAGPAAITIGGRDWPATWTPPPPGVASAGWLLLQPGFTRRCSHLRETTRRLAATGWTGLCIDAPMTGGAPALAEALADALAPAGAALGELPVPPRLLVGGHSAGAAFAVALGARLQAWPPAPVPMQVPMQVPQRLAGVLLLDPVPHAGFEPGLQRIAAAGVPVLALAAPAQPCNARGAAQPALARAQAAWPSLVTLPPPEADARHADAEGEDSDALAAWACGRSSPAAVARLRDRAAAWAAALAAAGPGPAPAPAPGPSPTMPPP